MSGAAPEAGISVVELLTETGLCSSRSAARRLIQQGGAYLNGERIGDFELPIGTGHLTADGIMLKAGKKKVHRLQVRMETDSAGGS